MQCRREAQSVPGKRYYGNLSSKPIVNIPEKAPSGGREEVVREPPL